LPFPKKKPLFTDTFVSEIPEKKEILARAYQLDTHNGNHLDTAIMVLSLRVCE
jgi:hypothetical protein